VKPGAHDRSLVFAQLEGLIRVQLAGTVRATAAPAIIIDDSKNGPMNAFMSDDPGATIVIPRRRFGQATLTRPIHDREMPKTRLCDRGFGIDLFIATVVRQAGRYRAIPSDTPLKSPIESAAMKATRCIFRSPRRSTAARGPKRRQCGRKQQSGRWGDMTITRTIDGAAPRE
jgi:hypothetical protein